MEIKLSLLFYWGAYLTVTIIGIIHTIYNWKVLKIDTNREKEVKPSESPAYLKTKPFHVLYNIVVFPAFAYFYLHEVEPANLWFEAFILATSWSLITIAIDWVGWVIIKHPWSMTYKEMYIDYQPWITLIYLIIFASPFIAAFIL
ncbi:MAG: hypothetical protein RBT19_01950 [Tenuifilaceae bacterium]|jgi:hypothetical protein|nr:hypothetical protein [Tenuifilaceae bacterium]